MLKFKKNFRRLKVKVQLLEVSGAVRRIYRSLGFKGLVVERTVRGETVGLVE